MALLKRSPGVPWMSIFSTRFPIKITIKDRNRFTFSARHYFPITYGFPVENQFRIF